VCDGFAIDPTEATSRLGEFLAIRCKGMRLEVRRYAGHKSLNDICQRRLRVPQLVRKCLGQNNIFDRLTESSV
jgi:hypothetical protein